MKRRVFDTNILVSALIWTGSPRLLFQQGFGDGVHFITSPELRATLAHPKLQAAQRARGLDPDTLLDAVRVILHNVDSPICPKSSAATPTTTPCWPAPPRHGPT